MRERMREGKNPAPMVGGSSLLVIFVPGPGPGGPAAGPEQLERRHRLLSGRLPGPGDPVPTPGGGAPRRRDGGGGGRILLRLPHLRCPDVGGPGAADGGEP